MPRPKKAANGVKHSLGDDFVPLKTADERPAKKAKLLDDSDEESGNEDGGVALKVNEEYAKRFEHNKKRAERHRRKPNPILIFSVVSNDHSGGKVRQGQEWRDRRR
jgi:hypothetical protein